MKFRSLAFKRFGGFEERLLAFPKDGRDLHIIFGPNEAGKSTALVGLSYFLFGFPHNVTHAFRYVHGDQRIAATIEDRQGQILAAVRRRGTKNTLRDADDKAALAEDVRRTYLGGLDKDQFAMLFGLDHARLVAGGEDMATGQGSLGQTLFAAGAGLAGLRRIDNNLEARLADLFKRAGQKQAIAVGLNQLKTERQELKSKTIAIEAWLAKKDQLESALARQKELECERATLQREKDELASYRAALPTLQSIDRLEEQRRELGNVSLLAANFGDLYRATVEEQNAAQAQFVRAHEAAEKAAAALAAIPPEPHVFAEDAAILQVTKDLGAILKADQDRDKLVPRMREHQGEARLILTRYFDRDDITAAESLRVSQADQDRIRSLGETRAGLQQASRSFAHRLKQIDSQIADLDRQMTDAAPPVDEATLDSLARELLQDGPLEKLLATRIAELHGEQSAATLDLARLGPRWKGDLQALARLTPLSAEQVAVYETRLSQLDSEIRDIEKRRDKEAKVIRERTRQLEALEKAGHVPDDVELGAARRERDAVVDRLIASAEARDEHGKTARGDIRRCDDLSDTMRREATRVSEAARCRADLAAAHEEHGIAVVELEKCKSARDDLLSRWVDEWRSTCIQPGEPSEMRGWLTQWALQRDRVAKLDAIERDIARITDLIEVHKAKLRTALSVNGADTKESLVRLHDRAKAAIDAARTERSSRAERTARLQGARTERDSVQSQWADAERVLGDWRESWGRAVAAIGLTADAEPATAHHYLDQLAEIFRELREANTIALRLEGIDRDQGEFIGRLEALRLRILGAACPAFDRKKLQVAVDELVRRLEFAKLRQREREKIEADLQGAQEALNAADQDVVRCRARMQALCEQAGVVSGLELPTRIARSDERRSLDARLADERVNLRHHAGDSDLVDFARAAEAARPALDMRLAAIKNRLEIIEAEIPLCFADAKEAQRQIDQWQEASSAAAECQQSIESLLAQLREQFAEYATLHLARQTLRLTVERFRERHHDSLLSRAERHFHILTRGAFAGLEIDDNGSGESILLAIRREPRERVDVHCLSDGTRDQLFLALRLAGIEQHIQSHGPMPVVVDDVLVNFDDHRAAATLECLAELSKRTQVMVFTHHAHVVELAKNVAPDAVCCHDLSAEKIGQNAR